MEDHDDADRLRDERCFAAVSDRRGVGPLEIGRPRAGRDNNPSARRARFATDTVATGSDARPGRNRQVVRRSLLEFAVDATASDETATGSAPDVTSFAADRGRGHQPDRPTTDTTTPVSTIR